MKTRCITPPPCTAPADTRAQIAEMRAQLPEHYALNTYYPIITPKGMKAELAEVWGRGRQSNIIYLHVRWPITVAIKDMSGVVQSTYKDYRRLVVNTTTGDVKEL